MNLHVGVSPIQSPVMSYIIPSQEESWEENNLVIQDPAEDFDSKSDFLICYKSWHIFDFSNQIFFQAVCEPFPCPVHHVHLFGKVDSKLRLFKLGYYRD